MVKTDVFKKARTALYAANSCQLLSVSTSEKENRACPVSPSNFCASVYEFHH